jgi:regulator of protease activity HflC (stomatin/prohibitin superfamily)
MRRAALIAVIGLLAACTSVDSTEHCVETRYGKVVNQRMGTGLNITMLTQATCFTMTEKNYPATPGAKEMIPAQTQDPITVEGDLAIVYKYDPATIIRVFEEKRTPDAAETEIINAIREGYRNALAQWTIAEIFSNRAALADSVKFHIQRKIGDRALIQQVFVRDVKVPASIEQARIQAAQQAQVLDKALKQYVIDSVNARAVVLAAQATAEATRLAAQSYVSNPKLLELEIAKAYAEGLKEACKGVQTCVIGASVMDTFRRP